MGANTWVLKLIVYEVYLLLDNRRSPWFVIVVKEFAWSYVSDVVPRDHPTHKVFLRNLEKPTILHLWKEQPQEERSIIC